jgi:universal stress protein E
MALSKIMVVIDPTSDRQPAFDRALDSARLTGAQLFLYTCVNQDSGHESLEQAQQALHPLLEGMSNRALADGVEATCEIDWAADWHREAVAAAARSSASMVFKNSFDHSAVQRELRSTSDWALLRMSPCPVLMVKDHHDWKHRRVLSAINPASTDQAHIKLNHQIISFTQSFSEAYGSDAHFVIAHQDMNHVPDAATIAEDFGAPLEHVHIAQGKASDVIRDTARQLDVDLVIVGTVRRDGIKGRVVGNTCEKLLDQTDSDLLVLN